jgi:hypothetical protein
MDEDRAPGFYWVLPVFDADSDPDGWMNAEQPAYWTGEKWEMLATEDWQVRRVCEPVVRATPTTPPIPTDPRPAPTV